MLRTNFEDCSAKQIGHYIRRAREERELAFRALGSQASNAHLERAKQYEALVMRAEALDDGRAIAADYEISNLLMSSQRLSPFHQQRAIRPSFVAR